MQKQGNTHDIEYYSVARMVKTVDKSRKVIMTLLTLHDATFFVLFVRLAWYPYTFPSFLLGGPGNLKSVQ